MQLQIPFASHARRGLRLRVRRPAPSPTLSRLLAPGAHRADRRRRGEPDAAARTRSPMRWAGRGRRLPAVGGVAGRAGRRGRPRRAAWGPPDAGALGGQRGGRAPGRSGAASDSTGRVARPVRRRARAVRRARRLARRLGRPRSAGTRRTSLLRDRVRGARPCHRRAMSTSGCGRVRAAQVRRLQSEAQMLLHHAAVNDAREGTPALPVNSFWLSGCGVQQTGSDVSAAGRRPAAWSGAGAGLGSLGRRLAGTRRRTGRRAAASRRARRGRRVDAVRRAPRAALRDGDRRWAVVAPDARGLRTPDVAATLGALVKLTVRDVPPRAAWALEQAGVPALLARAVRRARVTSAQEVDDGLAHLPRPRDARRGGGGAAARRRAGGG